MYAVAKLLNELWCWSSVFFWTHYARARAHGQDQGVLQKLNTVFWFMCYQHVAVCWSFQFPFHHIRYIQGLETGDRCGGTVSPSGHPGTGAARPGWPGDTSMCSMRPLWFCVWPCLLVFCGMCAILNFPTSTSQERRAPAIAQRD